MKKTKVFIALGSLTMAIVGIFATKPTKKFGAATQLYAGGSYGVILLGGGTASSNLTTVNSGSLHAAQFKTASGNAITLKTSSGGNFVYFK